MCPVKRAASFLLGERERIVSLLFECYMICPSRGPKNHLLDSKCYVTLYQQRSFFRHDACTMNEGRPLASMVNVVLQPMKQTYSIFEGLIILPSNDDGATQRGWWGRPQKDILGTSSSSIVPLHFLYHYKQTQQRVLASKKRGLQVAAYLYYIQSILSPFHSTFPIRSNNPDDCRYSSHFIMHFRLDQAQ